MLTFSILVGADKERKVRVVEWVEKASFDHLNKLFVITSNEKNHQTLLFVRNLLVIIQEPQPYILPIILRWLPKVVVPGEHHVLKDLPFYEEAHEANAKACQESLDQKEEKSQEWKLRKAPGEKDQASSSATRPSTKKKKSSTKVVKVSTSVPDSPSVSTFSTSMSMDSSVPNLGGDLNPPRFEQSDLSPRSSKFELVTHGVIYEPEVEEDMETDLRSDFRERQHKRLSEPIEVVAPLTKKTCPEEVHEEPTIDVPPMPMPPPDAARSSSALTTVSLSRK